jgi:GWxTD domain-containing protein
VAPAPASERRKPLTADDLINVFLAPRHAQWLVGPIAHLATAEEIETFLALTDDAEAERFIDEFWARRRPASGLTGMTARQQYEHLAEEADRRFTEAAFPGRRTDRGTIFILYGPPAEIDYQQARRARDGELEIWRYGPEEVRGLDGTSPRHAYVFIKTDDLTRFARLSELPRLHR